DHAKLDRVAAHDEYHGDARARRLHGAGGRDADAGDDYRWLPAGDLGRQCWQAVALALGPAKLDPHVAAVLVAGRGQAAAEGGAERPPIGRRPRAEESDHRHGGLLRARRQRPRRRAGEDGDESATPHSITSSASASSVGGAERPRALAVTRLSTK